MNHSAPPDQGVNTPPTDEISRVLRENGLTDRPDLFDSSIHSWRCEHVEQYGPCSCFQELVDDLAALFGGAA